MIYHECRDICKETMIRSEDATIRRKGGRIERAHLVITTTAREKKLKLSAVGA